MLTLCVKFNTQKNLFNNNENVEILVIKKKKVVNFVCF